MQIENRIEEIDKELEGLTIDLKKVWKAYHLYCQFCVRTYGVPLDETRDITRNFLNFLERTRRRKEGTNG